MKAIHLIPHAIASCLLAACGGEQAVEPESVAQTAPAPAPDTMAEAVDCTAEPGVSFLCGVENGEDILAIGDSGWLLVSGMDGNLAGTDANGKIHLVNAADRTAEILFPGANPVIQQDLAGYPDCPGPLETANFSAHGLSLQAVDKGPDMYRLYMTSHGAREAIEVFELEAFVKPTIKWVGCIPMPASSWTNSVAQLADGGFVATQFFDPARHTIDNVMAGEVTGHIFEWHPGSDVTVVPGTEMAGANGIAVSADERWIFAASFGTGEVVRFDRSTNPPTREAIPVGVFPDNIRWTPQGTLYTAGNNTPDFCGQPPCPGGWGVVEITPDALIATRVVAVGEDSAMHDASSALRVGDEIWVGTYGGDRLAILPAN